MLRVSYDQGLSYELPEIGIIELVSFDLHFIYSDVVLVWP